MMPLVVLGGCCTRNWNNFVATVSLVLVAWLYSVPPLPAQGAAAARFAGQWARVLSVAIHDGLQPGRRSARRCRCDTICSRCASAASTRLATAADYEADRAAGHRTMAVAFGRRAAAAFALRGVSAHVLARRFWQRRPFAFTLLVCAIATFVAAIVPRNSVIAAACVTIFAGFLIAAIGHLAGY